MKKILEGKNLLITAGPTWVAIDKVRVITNIFSGRTGCIIAKAAKEMGAKVKVLLGPGRLNYSPGFFQGMSVIRYRYFAELLNLVTGEISQGKYDVIIHSAAVSDYTPTKTYDQKIPSRKNELTIKLKPTIKIIQEIGRIAPSIYLVQFKLEVDKRETELVDEGFRSMLQNKADLCVVNDLNKMDENNHEAFILGPNKRVTKVANREELAKELLKIISQEIAEVRD